MNAVIDKTGRVVIPISIRSDLNLVPGSELEISLEGENIILHPKKKECLVQKDGITFVSSEWQGETDISKILQKIRESRDMEYGKDWKK